MNEAFIHSADFALFHAGTHVLARVIHGEGREFVGQTHALDFLTGLDRTGFVEEWGRVHNLAAKLFERFEIRHHESGRLANHAVGGLRAHVEFDGNFVGQAPLLQDFVSAVPGAELRRARIALVVAFEIENVLCPRVTLGIGLLRLEGNQRGLAMTRKDDGVISLHAPVVGEIQNIIRRAADQRGKVLIFHQGTNTIEFYFVCRPSHSSFTTQSQCTVTGLFSS